MRRGRKATDDGSGDATPSKKSRTKIQIDGKDVRFEWEADGLVWTQYTDNLNESIIQAYLNKKKEFSFDVGTATLIIVFEKFDEKGGWNPYGIKASLDLENCYHGDDKTVDVEACHRSYTIDIGKMEQTNTVTKVIRKVARNVANGVAPTVQGTVTATTSNGASSSKKGKRCKSQR
ncbi:hypothetical protein KUTeg_019593 [Tegillarca granosa]|uniref:WWE domain-containing protein n=1 Tax=Tegillarca granosa TaxID=220873 RepID=A0ABQ9EH29_TEGGR|nr:hypothetical protein KUTeg_019593 [Tegillarca granosa]